MQLNRASLVLGAVLATFVLLSFSAAVTSGPPRIEYGPNPRDMLVIEQGTPLVVPAGKIFVLTGLGKTVLSTAPDTFLRIDGVDEASAASQNTPGMARSMINFPLGLTASAGSTVDVHSSVATTTGCRAWGYLSDHD